MTAPGTLRLVSHHLCPYAQRVVIALNEKHVTHERTYIDLTAKPNWFTAISPFGKVPLLLVDEETALFESAVICEFLEETAPGVRLHPDDAIERARHRAWVEFASATLGAIAGLYIAPDAVAFDGKRADLATKMASRLPPSLPARASTTRRARPCSKLRVSTPACAPRPSGAAASTG